MTRQIGLTLRVTAVLVTKSLVNTVIRTKSMGSVRIRRAVSAAEALSLSAMASAVASLFLRGFLVD